MKYATVIVKAARKNPELNKKEDFKDKIAEKYGKKAKDIYVSFQGMPKIGINPNPIDDTTPIGIYAFPLKHIFDQDFKDRPQNIVSRDYVYILRRTSNKVLTIPDKSFDVDKAVTRLAELLSTKYYDKLDAKWKITDPVEMREKIVTYEGRLYKHKGSKYFYSLITTLGHIVFNGRILNANIFNHLFYNLGYEVIEDKGTATVHTEEPTQTIFMTKKCFKVLEVISNYSKTIEVTTLKELEDLSNNMSRESIMGDYLRSLIDLPQRNSRYVFNIDSSKHDQLKDVFEIAVKRKRYNREIVTNKPKLYSIFAATLYRFGSRRFNSILTYLSNNDLKDFLPEKFKLDENIKKYEEGIKDIFTKTIKKYDKDLPIPKYKNIDPTEILSLVRNIKPE